MKKTKLQSIIYLVIWFLELAALAFSVATVWRMDMLPNQYLVILVAAAMLLWSLTGLLLFLPSGKRGGGKIRRGFACVLVLLVVLVCAGLVTVAMDLYETLHQMVDDPTNDTITRGIYVRVDDPAQSLEDTRDYTFAKVTGYDAAYTDQTIKSIESTLGSEITVEEYDSVPDMVDALYGGDVDAIILNSAYVTILEEDTAHTDFSQRTRVLCRIELQKEEIPVTKDPDIEPDPDNTGDPNETEPPDIPSITLPSIEDPQDITNTPFVVYVSGNDSRGSHVQDGRSDVNILAVVNPETKQILLINTPRDYYIPNPAGGGRMDKLTHCGNDGIMNSIEAISDLYGIRIDYFAHLNFSGFEALIDAIGGVTVYSDVSFTASSTYYAFQKGENKLDGAAALAFARERYHLPGGDNARGQNQMKVIKAVIEKMTTSTALITGYADILDSLGGMFRMNLTVEEITQLVKMQLDDMASWTISSYAAQGRGDGGMERTYSVPWEDLWVMYPDYDTVEHASMLIQKVVSGETLTEADLAGPTK